MIQRSIIRTNVTAFSPLWKNIFSLKPRPKRDFNLQTVRYVATHIQFSHSTNIVSFSMWNVQSNQIVSIFDSDGRLLCYTRRLLCKFHPLSLIWLSNWNGVSVSLLLIDNVSVVQLHSWSTLWQIIHIRGGSFVQALFTLTSLHIYCCTEMAHE